MTPGDALGITLQVAVALAGFTGIVAVFASAAVHEWRPLDRLRLRLLLTMSTLPLCLCLLAILLLTTGLRDDIIWRIMSALSVCVFAFAGFVVQRQFRRMDSDEINRVPGSKAVFTVSGLAGATTIVLMIYNTFALGVFWPFFAAIVCSMMASVLQFVRLIVLQPGRIQ